MVHAKEKAPEETQGTSLDPKQAKADKLEKMRAKGIDPYPHVYRPTHKAADILQTYETLENGIETEDEVSVAGRIMAMRNNGMFIDLHDETAKIQVFSHKESLSEEQLENLTLYDIGDVIGVKGTVRRTPRGEISVRAKELTMLTKSLLPLPEKYHGLTDIEQRYRQRYLDMIMSEESRETLRKRVEIVNFIRSYMTSIGAVEVETPMLHPIMGGASAKPFITHHNSLDTDFFLKVAAELYLKRLLVGGFAEHVYEMGRYFRNEGLSPKHNPEFTMIEGNVLWQDYHDIMDMLEDVMTRTVEHACGTLKITYGETEIDFSRPWKRAGMVDLVTEETGVNFHDIESDEDARKKAEELGVHVEKDARWGHVVGAVFEEKVEDKLINPVHVIDHPVDTSPLAKTHRENPRLVERVETFVNGWELTNGFTELNDPKIQLERFEEQMAAREAGDEEAQMLDEDYITALEYGLPPNCGWAIGIDRFVMLLTNAPSIKDVICFPTLKPVKS